ncbi:MAG: AtpZ/AtpI family protein [Lachnospiraceae bacterium]|jgi:F0F1-type ATP synthase assembly protein I|nr:AtpZ/AtpI family protein [Lachnospiraceae bacterium]
MNKDVQKTLVLITQFGISMIVPIGLCMFLGIFVADKLSAPIITVPFFIVGALAGFRNVYILAKSVYKDDKKKEQDTNDKEDEQRP